MVEKSDVVAAVEEEDNYSILQLMKLISFSILLLLLFNQCATKNAVDKSADAIEYKGYYSDYFVFVADDGDSPLVIPIDINWRIHEEGYEREYKLSLIHI